MHLILYQAVIIGMPLHQKIIDFCNIVKGNLVPKQSEKTWCVCDPYKSYAKQIQLPPFHPFSSEQPQ